MASEAIYHHLIPQTYMKPWCFSGQTLWAYNKAKNEWKERNIENICGINYFHSIRANSLYVTSVALAEIWGFLDAYHISLDGVPLDTHEKLHTAYPSFDNWEILYPSGSRVNKAQRNVIKETIKQAKYNEIEEQWSIQFENGWANLIAEISQAIADIRGKKPVMLTSRASSELMKYLVMFDWRSFSGNKQFNDAFQWIDSIFPFSSSVVPKQERVLATYDNALENMKHELLVKEFDDFQSGRGVMFTQLKAWEKHCTIMFLLPPKGSNFITSDNPCFTFVDKNGCKEPFFVALPQLAIVLIQKDPHVPNSYFIRELTESELVEYNTQVFNFADNLVLNNTQFDVRQYLKLDENSN